MVFDTLEDYDKELNEMETDLSEMEAYLQKHPESFGTQGNYETYKYVYLNGARIPWLLQVEDELHKKSS